MHLLQIKPVVPAWKSSSAAAAQCPPRMLSNKAVSTQAHLGMLGTSNASALYPYFPFFYILHFLFSPSSSLPLLTFILLLITSNLLHLFFCFVSWRCVESFSLLCLSFFASSLPRIQLLQPQLLLGAFCSTSHQQSTICTSQRSSAWLLPWFKSERLVSDTTDMVTTCVLVRLVSTLLESLLDQ